MDRALELALAADEGIELALLRALGEVRGEGLEGILGEILAVGLPVALARRQRPLFARRRELRDAVGEELQHVEARDAVGAQQSHRVGVGLLEERCDQVAGFDLVLLGARGVLERVLDHPVEGQGLLELAAAALGELLDLVLEELLELALQPAHPGADVLQHLFAALVVEQRVEQVLDGQVGVMALHGLARGRLERELQLPVDLAHSSSTPARSG